MPGFEIDAAALAADMTDALRRLPAPWIRASSKANQAAEASFATAQRAVSLETDNDSFDPAECLDRVRKGDNEAAEELIRQIYPQVIRIVRRNLARRDAEEDVLQEILIRILSKLESYRGDAPFEHWISRIAVNVCLNRIRTQKARPEWRWADLSEEQAEALTAVSAGQSLEPHAEVAAKQLVDHLLASLSPEDRLIMRLLEMEGLTVKEVCAQTGWTGAFVRVRAFRARRKLNQKFSHLWRKGEL